MRILNDIESNMKVKFGAETKEIANSVINRVETAKSLFMERLQKQGKFKETESEAQRLEILLGGSNTELTAVRKVKLITDESPIK